MNSYEVNIENVHPCRGPQRIQTELIEIEADSPEEYVKETDFNPIIESHTEKNGDVVITTLSTAGYINKYTFTLID